MSKKSATTAMYVTADEAVARLINLQTLPTTFSLLDITSAFLDEAETNLANARLENKSDVECQVLMSKHNICHCRHELAQNMLQGIRLELQSPQPRIRTRTGSLIGMLDWQSVRAWASDEHEIAVAAETQQITEVEVQGDHPKFSEKLLELMGPKGYSQIKTANLLACFYMLVHQYAKKRPKDFLKHDEQLNVDILADEVSQHVLKDYPYFEPYGQSRASWKAQIQAAREVFRSATEKR